MGEIKSIVAALNEQLFREWVEEMRKKSVEENDEADVLGALQQAGAGITKHMIIPYGSDQIDDAIEYLQTVQAKQKEKNQQVQLRRVFKGHPLDGAHALAEVFAEKFNWTALIPSPGFFGERPPGLVTVQTLKGEVEIPWGRMQIPGIGGYFETGMSSNGQQFMVTGVVAKKNFKEVNKLFDLVDVRLSEHSIYRGNAIKLRFPQYDGEEYDPIFTHSPLFLDMGKFNAEGVVLSEYVQRRLEREIFRPMEKVDQCRKEGISLKRGVLLAGEPGVGKTLTGMLVAQKAIEQNWTYVYAEHCRYLKPVIDFALNHQPAVVFAEDIDRPGIGAKEGEDFRTDMMNAIMTVMDGIEAKNTELIVVLTTNHLDRITKAMKRPGRIDSIIPMGVLDTPATEKLIRMYSGDKMNKKANLDEAIGMLSKASPAVISEVVQRTKLYTIDRVPMKFDGSDIVQTIHDMNEHIETTKSGRMGYNDDAR